MRSLTISQCSMAIYGTGGDVNVGLDAGDFKRLAEYITDYDIAAFDQLISDGEEECFLSLEHGGVTFRTPKEDWEKVYGR